MLCPLGVWAQRTGTEQEFHVMAGNGTLTFAGDDNKIGITDFVTYTCSGHKDAVFGLYPPFPSIGGKVSIILPKNGTVTTTKIADLVGLSITHRPATKCTDVQVSISMDSINWIVVSTPESYYFGAIDIPNFVHDSYYVKITNTTKTDFAIRMITYYTDNCNCFRYVAE